MSLSLRHSTSVRPNHSCNAEQVRLRQPKTRQLKHRRQNPKTRLRSINSSQYASHAPSSESVRHICWFSPEHEPTACGPGVAAFDATVPLVKTYETPMIEARQLNAPERKAAVFQFDVTLSQLKPGLYTTQINVIDDAGGTFSFPRMPILVREKAAPKPAAGIQ